jgi:hypothetical protein
VCCTILLRGPTTHCAPSLGSSVVMEGARLARDAALVIPTMDANLVTPHTEASQAVICHLLVSHPAVAIHQGKGGVGIGTTAAAVCYGQAPGHS